MKKIVMILLCGGIASVSAEECVLAVDVAESMNVNASNECDSTDSGLNGVVHRWFKRDRKSSAGNSPQEKEIPRASIKVSPPANSAESLATARFELLSAISQECVQGFRITDEMYLPVDGELTIRLLYECL